MAHFLFATHPITGHFQPAVPIVRELRLRGHQVSWYAGASFQAKVEELGATFEPYQQAYDYDDRDYNTAFPGRDRLTGLNQIKFDFLNLFIKATAPMYHDLQRIVNRERIDVIVNDPAVFAAYAVAENGGPPNALYNITCLGIKGRDVAPFGLGLLPNSSPVGLVRNRVLQWVAPNIVFGNVSAEFKRQLKSIGARPRPFEGIVPSPYLSLALGVPALEYPRSDLPDTVHFIGSLMPGAPEREALPSWWTDVATTGKAVVLVTQGTVATTLSDLILPAIRALSNEPVSVVVAGADPAALGDLPANVFAAKFIPFGSIMDKVDVFVTNGGFGGVQFALSNGVPVVTAGVTEDKLEVGNRVARSGAGINLKTSTPSDGAIRSAVRSVFNDPSYRKHARRIQTDLAAHDAPVEAATLLETLAATKSPVRRTASPVWATT